MTRNVVALSGGVGGAKLVLGLARVLPEGSLSVIANTGDDFRHFGLAISPDIDTLVYTLAGLADPVQGWGRRDETWHFMAALAQLGEETWFQLGDRDLAMHVARTRRLDRDESLSQVTQACCRHLGIATRILPMTDDPVHTRVRTDAGWLDFQDYFVRERCSPPVRELAYVGASAARALPEAIAALSDPGLRAVVICPSNPYLSIDPMLAIPALRAALEACQAPIVAISPIIGGKAVKGPTAKLMAELGLTPSASEVARRYADLIDVFVVDTIDAGVTEVPELTLVSAPTLMTTLEDREQLARVALAATDEFKLHHSVDRRS
jgi:LPPG:FO 2-phospho-L-lactate transferase